jgi:hypothetical protein
MVDKIFEAETEIVKDLEVKQIEIKQCVTIDEAINWITLKGGYGTQKA